MRDDAAARHARLREIVLAADELAHEERARFLAESCAGDAELMREALEILGDGRVPTQVVAPTSAASSRAEDVPARLGPFRVLREIGRGGMGVVYEAEDARSGARVAVKAIHAHLLGHPRVEERFAREAAAGARVVHPNVVRTLGVERVEDDRGRARTVLVTELVAGRTLRQLLADLGRAPEPLIREIARGVARGVAALHACGVVHRDLKPENVMLTADSRVRVMDLGVALDAASGRLTRQDEFVGSLDYAAPEQCGGGDVGPAADLYATGVLLHELATGENPFARSTALATVAAHATFEPPDLTTTSPSSSPFLAAVVRSLLAKDPAARPASADDLARIVTEGEEGAWWQARVRGSAGPAPVVPVARELALRGRSREMAALHAALDEARAGRPSAVLVAAEPGHGKSRLLDEFHRSIAEGGARFVYAAMPPSGGTSAMCDAVLAAMGRADPAEWLVARAGMSRPHAALVAAFLRREPPPAGAQPLDADAAEAALRRVLAALSAEAPVVIALDDVQHAGPGPSTVLSGLVRRPADGRVMLLLAGRPGPDLAWTKDLAARGALRTLVLPRLAADDVEAILRDALGREDLATRAARRIVAKSGGVPLYVAAIVGTLRERLAAVAPERRGELIDHAEVPMALREVLADRLAPLDRSERDLLDACAVQGVQFDPELAAAVAGVPVVRALQTLASVERRTAVVRADARAFRFDHQLLQEEVLAAMPPRLREEHHLATARALAASGRGRPEDLARHFLEGSEPALARPWLVPALDALLRRDERAAALELAERALAIPALLGPADRCELLVRAADVHDAAGRRDAQRASARAAVDAARDTRDLLLAGRAHQAVAVHLSATGGDRAALPRFRAAIRLARRAHDRGLEARASTAAGLALARTGRVPEARRRLAAARDVAIAAGDAGAEQSARLGLAALELSLERPGEAQPELVRALDLARSTGSLRAEGHAEWGFGVAEFYAGRWESARTRFLRARDLGRASGARTLEVNAASNVAICLQAEGRWDEAIVALEESRPLVEEAGEHTALCLLLLNLALAHMMIGDAASAEEALGRAEAMAADASFRPAQARARSCRGELRAGTGDLEGAAAAFRESAETFGELGDPGGRVQALLGLASVLRETGDVTAAIAAADEARALAGESARPTTRMVVEAARASLPGGDAVAARAALEAAERRAPHEARMHARRDLYLASGDRRDAEEARRLAAVVLDRLPEPRRAVARSSRFFREIASVCAAAGLPPP